MSSTREAHSHSHGHGHTHHSGPSPAVMAEKLLELKNSDPELFNQAWRQIPQSTQENILAYLKKHGGDGKVESRPQPHGGFEDKHPHAVKHRGVAERPAEPERLERSKGESSELIQAASSESRKAPPVLGRPLYEWTDGELLAHTFLEAEAKNSSSNGKVD